MTNVDEMMFRIENIHERQLELDIVYIEEEVLKNLYIAHGILAVVQSLRY